MSRIFQPFRAVGVVSGDVPFSFNSLGSENFVTVPVGNSFHVYNCSDLRLSLVSSLIDRPITSVCNVNETTFTACGSSLLVWYRAHIVQRLDGEHGANITSLLSFGPTVVSISAKDSRVCVWNVVARDGSNVELVTTFRLDRGYSKNNDISSSDDGSSSNNSNNSDESSNSDSDSDSDSNSVKCSSSFRERPFYVTAALHPATYINKIVLGSSSGELELWNVATRTKIHTMQCVSSNIIRGSVTALAQSPAADVIGVGYSSGEILIINLAYDEILMRFNQREGLGCVTSLSFRTDSSITSTSGTNTARLVSTGETGSFAIWDLEHKRLESIYNNAHDGRIVSATFMPREPLLLTSGEDNSLRMFIFDQPDGSARQLKSRVGHWLPPTQIRFYGGEVLSTLGDGADGAALQILSSGLDQSFRSFHVVRDAQSRELSQGKLISKARKLGTDSHTLKLSPMVRFEAKETRGRDWCDIISCHEGSTSARVWSFEKKRLGEHVLEPSNVIHHHTSNTLSKKTSKHKRRLRESLSSGTSSFTVTAVGLSTCGNYGLVGDSRGIIHRYNMQSGQARGTYPKAKGSTDILKIKEMSKKRKLENGSENNDGHEFLREGRHMAGVTSIHTDSLNELMITTGLDGVLKMWDFRSHVLQHNISLGSAIGSSHMSRSGLLTCACDDFVLRVYDVSSRRVDSNNIAEPRRVRVFRGHTGRITDMCTTPDDRWLITSSTDSTVRVWDVPTARCVDWFIFEDAVTSMSLSPSGEFLATTHVENNGIFIWANRAHFGTVLLTQDVGSVPKKVTLPIPKVHTRDDRSIEDKDEIEKKNKILKEQNEAESSKITLPTNQLESGLTTMSGLAKSKWETLPNLDVIKARNKPIEPPKAPEKAPFFLGQLEGISADGSRPNLFEHSKVAVKVGYNSTLDGNEDEGSGAGSRLLRMGRHGAEMSLVGLLNQCTKKMKKREDSSISKEESTNVMNYLMTLSASGVDIQINSLSMGGVEDTEGLKHLKAMLNVFENAILSNENYDVVQAYLHRFFFVHGDTISESDMLIEACHNVRNAQKLTWGKVQKLLQETSCLVKLFTKVH